MRLSPGSRKSNEESSWRGSPEYGENSSHEHDIGLLGGDKKQSSRKVAKNASKGKINGLLSGHSGNGVDLDDMRYSGPYLGSNFGSIKRGDKNNSRGKMYKERSLAGESGAFSLSPGQLETEIKPTAFSPAKSAARDRLQDQLNGSFFRKDINVNTEFEFVKKLNKAKSDQAESGEKRDKAATAKSIQSQGMESNRLTLSETILKYQDVNVSDNCGDDIEGRVDEEEEQFPVHGAKEAIFEADELWEHGHLPELYGQTSGIQNTSETGEKVQASNREEPGPEFYIVRVREERDEEVASTYAEGDDQA
ncbi:hypothetical protein AYI69_g3567 [Smittium culicis]|uniref:Uncharacterized protein n=1 Tax=Smittium culicis TaxID=133412 RepID=A0A1R1YJN4_9FUNG|nr:hypothetical protein AYI69_g3567 [Smittium culicis]